MRRKLHPERFWAPRWAALATAAIGAVNVASALTPDIRWRGTLLLQIEPLSAIRFFHAISLPAGAALLLVAPYLFKRRRRAFQVAVWLLLALGAVNLLKGFDFEESMLGWALAALLFNGRHSFNVEPHPISLRSAVWRVPAIALSAITLITLLDWASHGRVRFGTILGETGALARFKAGPMHFETHTAAAFDHAVRFAWVPLAVHLVEIGALLAIAYLIFRPLATPLSGPSAATQRHAEEVVQQHGQDTLAFFKLRPDKLLYFNADSTAFVGYRIEAGTLLLSGDPVGPPEALPELLLDVRRFARSRGLRLAAVGASTALLPIYEGLGLRSLYVGDEAVIELDGFSLEGRPIRKVRQSVARLRKAGYQAELRHLHELDPETLGQLDHVMEVGRVGRSERGFSMGLDGIRCPLEQDTVLILGRDGDGVVRGMLHFVPCYGRPAVSLSMMRRDTETPNGLMEFLVVEAIERLRDEGISEMSLNFASASKYLREPDGPVERALGWFARVMNPYFQIESLYRFNVKFFPRWNPRYLVYEGRMGFVRASLASIWAEGQLPKPVLPRPDFRAHVGQRTLKTANR